MFKKFVTIGIVVLLLVAMTACTPAEDSAAEGDTTANEKTDETVVEGEKGDTKPADEKPAEGDKKIKLGLVVQALSNPFHTELQIAAEKAAAEHGVEIVVLASANIEEQLKVMEDLIETGPDAIAVTSYDAKGIIPAVEKAKEKGIAVFAVDNNIVDTEVSSFIGTDNVYGGQIGAEWIVDKIGEDGVLGVILGTAGSFAGNARNEGLKDKLKEYPNVKVVGEVVANWKRDLGLQVATDIITANPDLDCIFALNDEMALGAAQAIAAANKKDEILLIGYNGVPEAVQATYDGLLTATVVQFPEIMASTYVEKAIDLVTNGTIPDKEYLVPAAVVDTELAKAVFDDDLAPASDFEELLYAKIIKFLENR